MMLFAPNRSAPDAKALWQEWRSDVGCVFARDPAARSWLEVMLAYPGVHAVLLYRVSHRWWQADFKLCCALIVGIYPLADQRRYPSRRYKSVNAFLSTTERVL